MPKALFHALRPQPSQGSPTPVTGFRLVTHGSTLTAAGTVRDSHPIPLLILTVKALGANP